MNKTIENVNGTIWLCQHGTYDNSSVNEGYPFRQLQKPYPCVEDAIAANPGAEVCVDQDLTPPAFELSHNPPSWFDAADAGERWDDDY